MSYEKFYAGIGSRETPSDVLLTMGRLSRRLDLNGWTLRSGGAKGADLAFENGSSKHQIFRANDATDEAIALASQYHPNWAACNEYTRKLHGRNAMILLGQNLDTPVSFVYCWTPQGRIVGGTGQALRMAADYGIEVRNLALKEVQERVKIFLRFDP